MIVYKTKKYSLKKTFLATGIGILIISLVAVGVYIMSPGPAVLKQEPTPDSSAGGANSPSVQKNDTGEDVKENSVRDETESTQTSPDTKKSVPIGVSYAGVTSAGAIEVRAFMSEIIEGNGTCTATFTKAGLVVSATSPAFIDATTSQCEPMEIPASQFTQKGTWSLIVSYDSPDATGKSQSIEVSL